MTAVGAVADRTIEVTDALVRAFADITGDHNPTHLDESYAATTRFGRRIAHGLLAASQLSALLANELPGPGTIYLSQDLQFRHPIFIGDMVPARVEVVEFGERGRVRLATTCVNQDGTLLLEGVATVLQAAAEA